MTLESGPVKEGEVRIGFGAALLIVGLIVGIVTCSNRPPSTGMDALAILFQARQPFISLDCMRCYSSARRY